MEKVRVVEARRPEAIGRRICVQGWIRTRRDSKGGFSFLELNDGSCLGNLTIIAEAGLPNYEAEIKRLSPGCSTTIIGQVKPSGGQGQATEVLAEQVTVHGWADPEAYPLQKKRHSFEKLREWAHLRPRTNSFSAVTRVRNCVSRSIHNFFHEDGFVYIHTPIITASDCEGAGEMFRVTTLDLEGVPKKEGRVDYTLDFFDRPLGYELWIPADGALAVWDALMAAGCDYGIMPAGIWALDVARIEAGLIMLDVDYHSAHRAVIEAQKSTPFELSLDWSVALDKAPFNGRRALLAEKGRGPAWRFVGIEVTGIRSRRSTRPSVSLPRFPPSPGAPACRTTARAGKSATRRAAAGRRS